MSLYKRKIFLTKKQRGRQKGEIRKFQSLKRTWSTIAGFADGEKKPRVKECGQLVKIENNPWPIATKKWRPQSYNHIKLNSANNVNELGEENISRALRKDDSPPDTLVLALWNPHQRTAHPAFSPTDCETINNCCFKSLHLCSFIMAAIEN